jgi:hypothetical protein
MMRCALLTREGKPCKARGIPNPGFDLYCCDSCLAHLSGAWEAYKQQIPIAYAIPFVTAIFDVGDHLSSERAGMYEMSPSMHALRIVLWYLKQEQNPVTRGQILSAAMGATDGLTLPLAFTGPLDPDQGDRTSPEELIPTDSFHELKNICVRKIATTLETGRFPHDLASVLSHWRAWAGPDAPTAFCERLVQTGDGLVRFLKAFLVCATSHGLGDRVGIHHWYVRRADIDAFLPFDTVETRVNNLPADLVLYIRA